MKEQRKIGVILSYVSIVLNMCSNFILIPILIATLSDDEYSIYKIMQSFSGPLLMFNLGISTIAARCVAKYKARCDLDSAEKENTLAMVLMIAAAMALLVLILGGILSLLIPYIYGSNYSFDQIDLAKKIFKVFVATTAVHILNDVFNGCVQGNEKFLFIYGIRILKHIVRLGVIILMLAIGSGALTVALIDLVISVLILVANILYSTIGLCERFHLYKIDKRELFGIFSFSAAILLQAIINQVNGNMDVMILGAIEPNKEVITMYSSALAIYAMYNSLVSVFAGIYLPRATQILECKHTRRELTDFVVAPGRVQAMIALAILCGFTLLGKDFVILWLGEKYSTAYYVALILMIPITIPLVQNVCVSVLDAKLKRLFRSIVLLIMAVINVIISLILVRFLGFWGAALGTVISLVVGHGLLINIYYQREIGFDVLYMFKAIFKGVLPAALIASVIWLPLKFLGDPTIPMFLFKGAIFVLLYVIALWFVGFNKNEKDTIFKMLGRKK